MSPYPMAGVLVRTQTRTEFQRKEPRRILGTGHSLQTKGKGPRGLKL